MTVVRVPASSANLGPGFDALGMALSLVAEVGVGDGSELPERALAADDNHPATIAFRRAGGTGEIWVRSSIPIGRGLGFSGAVRVGGAACAIAQRSSDDLGAFNAARPEMLRVAAELEGHADNAAASVYGGVVATDGVTAVGVGTPLNPDVVVWIPSATTSTNQSRTRLPEAVPFADAVHNIGRTAMLVAALATGDISALAAATDDRLHQQQRLAASLPSLNALDAGRAAGAWCAWLSGSGPTVAMLVERGLGQALAARLPADGQSKVLEIDRVGVALVG